MLRRVIINADDFGLTDSVNEAIVEVFDAGQLTSATLMVNMPGTPKAVALSHANPGLAIGLHFCLTEGRSLSGPSSITDAESRFLSRTKLLQRILQRKVRPRDIEEEFRAQLECFEGFGIQLSHVDSHQHIHMVPAVFRAMLPVLRERWIPLRVVEPFTRRSANPVKILKQHLLIRSARRIRAAYPVTPNTHLVSIHDLGGRPITASSYRDLLARGGDREVIELMVHPYKSADDLRRLYGPDHDKKKAFIEKCLAEYRILSTERILSVEGLELTTYQKAEEIQTRPLVQTDLPLVTELIRQENDDRTVSSPYLEHWYFDNPSASFTAEVAIRQERIQGIATTNNFRFRSDSKSVLVAMPQKVLTSRAIRGRGIFGRLYFETERRNLDELGVDFLITFTNAASTPIFLKRFGFMRAPSPELIFLPSNPTLLLLQRRYQRVERFDPDFLKQSLVQMPYGLEKGGAFYQWRYGGPDSTHYTKLDLVRRDGRRAGYIVLKRVRKRGLPICLLMDVVTSDPSCLPDMIRQAQRFATASGTFGLLCFRNVFTEAGTSGLRTLRAGRPFNFLVKGRSVAHTAQLTEMTFNLSFGDIDFF